MFQGVVQQGDVSQQFFFLVRVPHVAGLGRQFGIRIHGQGQVAHDVAYRFDAVDKNVHLYG